MGLRVGLANMTEQKISYFDPTRSTYLEWLKANPGWGAAGDPGSDFNGSVISFLNPERPTMEQLKIRLREDLLDLKEPMVSNRTDEQAGEIAGQIRQIRIVLNYIKRIENGSNLLY